MFTELSILFEWFVPPDNCNLSDVRDIEVVQLIKKVVENFCYQFR